MNVVAMLFAKNCGRFALFGMMFYSVLALGACAGQDRIPLRKLLVDVSPGAEGPEGEFEREKVRTVSKAFLNENGRFSLDDASQNSGDVLRVRVESSSKIVVPKQGPVLHLSLAMEWKGEDDAGKPFQFQAQSFVAGTVETPPVALLKQALEESFEQLLQAHGAREQPSETLLAWLGDTEEDANRKLQAIRILGARADANATAALAAVLAQPDLDLASAALGALTRIGDPRAVDAVIDYAERKPPIVRKQAIEAVRAMGTTRGMAWLFTLSTGHRHPDVQASAALALGDLEKQRSAGVQEPTVSIPSEQP